jgi:hypothetical protein
MVNVTLTMENGANGTTDPTAGDTVYLLNAVVTVTAIPDDINYALDYWTLDTVNVGSVNPYILTMADNYTLKAFFILRNPSHRRNKIRRSKRGR